MVTDLPFSPFAERNKTPLWEVLKRVVAGDAAILEIASGTGQHAPHFMAQSAACGWKWHWQPTEADASCLSTIDARGAGVSGLLPAGVLDVRELEAWPRAPRAEGWDAIFACNLLHISPLACSTALMQGAARRLQPQGHLIVYGPFVIPGVETVPSNLAFDADLKRRNAAWGLRSLKDVQVQAEQAGLHLQECCEMPANNVVLVFRR
jgi:SAM-dependent methyltransferase